MGKGGGRESGGVGGAEELAGAEEQGGAPVACLGGLEQPALGLQGR